jgi:hypothetical protein
VDALRCERGSAEIGGQTQAKLAEEPPELAAIDHLNVFTPGEYATLSYITIKRIKELLDVGRCAGQQLASRLVHNKKTVEQRLRLPIHPHACKDGARLEYNEMRHESQQREGLCHSRRHTLPAHESSAARSNDLRETAPALSVKRGRRVSRAYIDDALHMAGIEYVAVVLRDLERVTWASLSTTQEADLR